ncbi:MAG TPA: hypothetical protein VD926_08710, partial [Acidimicrobiales bacterium]|nr:hypothetical protein [Acidimicrobiales bacterium]
MKGARLAATALVVGLIGGFQAGRAEPVPTVVHAELPEPERVLLVGDSLLRQTGPALADRLGPGYAVRNIAVNGSGLLTPRFHDWPARVADELGAITPDLVVVEFVGNYTGDPDGLWRSADGRVVATIEDPAFSREWGRRTDALMRSVEPTGAAVVLVLPPPMPV